jgi:hypothetical protein
LDTYQPDMGRSTLSAVIPRGQAQGVTSTQLTPTGAALVLIFLITAGLLTMCILGIWPSGGDRSNVAPGRPEEHADVGDAEPVATSLEGALVRQVRAGEISRRQYGRAMERIAARDDERDPLAVPPAPPDGTADA